MKSEKTEEGTVMVNYIQSGLPPIGFWEHDSLSDTNHRLSDRGAKITDDENKLSYWQFIFLQSRANGCFYNVDDLPQANWQWPKDTWFQERLGLQLKDPRDHRLLA
jgi:hypothetical protein